MKKATLIYPPMADTDNLFSRVPFPPKAGIKTNNYISARTLALDFKIPWNFLVETNAAAEKTEAKTALNTIWWCLLEKVRTHFQKNPDL